MKKILNWTIGSFFRTIGRTIAFLVMGGLIYYIFTYNGFGLDDLFFTRVNASTLSIPVKKYQSSYFGVSNDTGLTQVAYGYVYPLTRVTNDSVSNRFFQFSTPIDGSNFDYIQFDFLLSIPNVSELNNDSTITGRYCSKYECYQYCATGGCAGMCEEYRCTGYTSYSNTIANEDIYPINLSDINFSVRMEYTDGNFAFCDIQNGKIICPTNHSSSIKGIDLYYNFRAEHISSASFILYRATEYYQIIDTQSAINNQTQQQQQQHQEVMDSNTTEAEEEATSFFEDFDVPDVGGLSAIITAPLNTIRSLLNSSCTNLSVPLPYMNNKYLTLPCMGPIYTEHFGLFFTLYQTIILAIISYRCIRSIYFDIHGFTDPSDDRIEVMDL